MARKLTLRKLTRIYKFPLTSWKAFISYNKVPFTLLKLYSLLKLTASSPSVRSADPLLLVTGLTCRSSDRSISASLLTLSFLADLREWNADGTRLCLNFAWSSCLCCSSLSRSCVLWRASFFSLAFKILETFRVGYLNEVYLRPRCKKSLDTQICFLVG